ncbi:MAG TPA: VanW family protein [Dongiaceae bacterium]|nr:VanW family protein [Dongiaceae bacterium]
MQRTSIDQLYFGLRANGLRARRWLKDLAEGPPLLSRTTQADPPEIAWPHVLGISITPLWPSANAAEHRLTAGKIQNLRQAVRRLNGLHVPAGTTFSFWRHVGRPIRWRGFVPGRELREGCLVASIGGGLCQLSNGLYAAARAAKCEIVERHRHSQVIPGSLAERDLDATVFWNYVDLRFRAAKEILLEVRLTTTDLVVHLRGRDDEESRELDVRSFPAPTAIGQPALRKSNPGDCLACGENSCVYHLHSNDKPPGTAWLLDEYWPEFDHWLTSRCHPQDQFHLPLDGRTWRRPNYAWHLPMENKRHTYPLLTLAHAMQMRRLAAQGAARQRALLERDRRLAAAYAADLAYETDRLVVAKNLLPYLWENGALGGRQFTVLMTRAPLADLQRALDEAARLHPASPTLRDFRAPDWLLAAEQAALRAARGFLTPHTELADMLTASYAGIVERVAWHLPKPPDTLRNSCRGAPPSLQAIAASSLSPRHGARPQARILFAGASLARKGAYEMRTAARQLPIRLRLSAGASETVDFWHGLATERSIPSGDPLDGVACVVLPAFVEYRPRLLLRAIARGLPVICTPACGLSGYAGVTLVEAGNIAALVAAIEATLASGSDASLGRAQVRAGSAVHAIG